MTKSTYMTRYQKQMYNEMQRIIANARCKICQEPIGENTYVSFEERYFHTHCLKQSSPKQHYSAHHQA
jgi:formylmethanofuran dehydrogenase subunit E